MNEVANNKNNDNYSKAITLSVIFFSLLYVVIRYNIFGGVPWKDFPLYILNKILSFSAFILLALTFAISPLSNLGIKSSAKINNSKKMIGIYSLILISTHAIISVLLLSPNIYSKFFESNGSFTFYAGMSILGGVAALVSIWLYNSGHNKNNKEIKMIVFSKFFILLFLFLVGIHLFFMGFAGWITPDKWHGGIPPVTLVAFTVFSTSFIINIIGRK